MSELLLAVDGGNSKTDVVLLGVDGTVAAARRGPTVSHQQVGLEEAGRRLRAQVDALRGPGDVIALAVLCLAGVDFPSDERALARAHGGSGFGRVVLENDTIAGLRAGSPTGWGVGVVVGAGINAVGVAPDGRRARFAGLGPLSGDRGGGEALGIEALGAAVRAGDGRGERTSLETLVPGQFGMRRPIDVTLAMYHGRLPHGRVAELAAVAVQAAREGDAVALGLLADLAEECAAFAVAAIRRLGMTRLEVPVVLSGGVARGARSLLADGVLERVRRVAPRGQTSVLHAPPVLGAALLALDEAAPGDHAAADRARAGITAGSFGG
ncbi:MAG TPA: BadF/BadG/BcrA/BcrD ATPase family protein [Candidatus Limnocylindrales bacterium]|nr:BadF/BadG/BcrA/BcrD ATPase family protein [Candidatus Limnocylindrales bacterium]